MRATLQNMIDSKIVEILKKHPYGLSTSQIAGTAGLNRMTVSRHLEVLKARGLVDYRQVGPAKLWYLTDNYLETTYVIQEVEKPFIVEMLKCGKTEPVRKRLGDYVSLHLFRLERLALILLSGADSIMYRIGQEIAKEVTEEMVDGDGIKDIFDGLAEIFEKLKIGILEYMGHKDGTVVIRIYECITCSGMPNIGKTVCYFEGGLMAGAYETVTAKPAFAIETKCWGTGYNYCEFNIKLDSK